MLNPGKKNCASRDKKNKYSNSCVVRKRNSERNKKPYPPPFQVKWSVPKVRLVKSCTYLILKFKKKSYYIII